MHAISMPWHSPLAQEANTMKAALVSPEVVMNIHMHMYTLNTEIFLCRQSRAGSKQTSL